MSILIFAPHQDDEIIGCFQYIKRSNNLDRKVHIVFATNGNYKSDEIATTRYFESINALKMCGVSEKQIDYLGYEDTGRRLNHSFLWRLYHSDNYEKNQKTNRIHTWHPNQEKTLHMKRTGKEAMFCKKNFIEDIKSVILHFQPNNIIIPSVYDHHGDHKALAMFVRKSLAELDYQADLHCYLIHTLNKPQWPGNNTLYFSKPQNIPNSLWENRLVLNCDVAQMHEKKIAISQFNSQLTPEDREFLYSFAKREEIFLPF